MRFATAIYDNEEFVGLVSEDGKEILNLSKASNANQFPLPATLAECIAEGDSFLDKVKILRDLPQEGKRDFYLSIDQVKLLAPIPKPQKNIFCVGKNYADHAIEMGSADDIPEEIMVFTKAPTTVIGDKETVLNHNEITSELDYEGELAVIIGRTGRAIPTEKALEYVFGYTIINDITARDLQAKHKQFFIGKSLDTTCPMGPWIVHHSLVQNPSSLNIQTYVNGELRQDSNTKHFIFPIDKIISELSKGMTLESGDIIATGTPAGVGKGFKPPRFLRAGDEIEISISGIGTLKNKIEE
ncbi:MULTISPECIES: fumarylacetoacetate hydrolase family protein [unclassified Bacillus (in: firmicutes)]|uniref:fumarylacetoacetate hydrolase family protein n=1 Tax=unclassified Bacillus (in: firmicutes) TaxID=185979 RepID=UPI0008F160A2|nr:MULTISPECIES: fumarylacetoacetate hydrolase family protein [unclassified Bacillus (in: firmicutes)]SFA79287.1 2-keto-4-pentenoate hydratase/2-oxohepta-3-ene-1,7-dioic acid hydratase (catechol pathway) [Bacillus sp. UNCCL13]SFQ69270.1 2-keto-4-pentenoate hydratase/2-oxohepta-3-ene-1,7-dioic acid hydratase (catechol pathway) [Bacillus sp. cl95]